MWEGYKSDHSTRRLLEFLEGKGMKIVSIHTSGHADVQTLKKVVESLRPKRIIPIHTFHPGAYVELGAGVLQMSDGIGVDV
jgi:ribonuclease J